MLRGMRSALRTLYTVGGAIGVLLFAIPTIAHAEASPDTGEGVDELDRWVPALGLSSGVSVQKVSAGVAACCNKVFFSLNGPPSPSSPPTFFRPPLETTDPLREPQIGGNELVTPFVGGEIEVSTPRLSERAWSPRLFGRFGAEADFSVGKFVAREGSPGKMQDPMQSFFNPVGISGQGSTTFVKVEPLVISAGFGVAFTFEAFDRRFRIKPSVEYRREETRVDGRVSVAQATNPGQPGSPGNPGSMPPAPPVPDVEASFRFLEFAGTQSKWFNGIGPGLELEMDAARAGPLMLTLYLSGQGYRWLGDRTIRFDSGEPRVSYTGPAVGLPNPPFAGGVNPDEIDNNERAVWTYERHTWGFRGAVGIRFRWQPK